MVISLASYLCPFVDLTHAPHIAFNPPRNFSLLFLILSSKFVRGSISQHRIDACIAPRCNMFTRSVSCQYSSPWPLRNSLCSWHTFVRHGHPTRTSKPAASRRRAAKCPTAPSPSTAIR